MKIALLGPQGCGKGTQSEMLSNEFGIPRITIGDLLRQEISHQTEIGKQIEPCVDA